MCQQSEHQLPLDLIFPKPKTEPAFQQNPETDKPELRQNRRVCPWPDVDAWWAAWTGPGLTDTFKS